MKPHVRWGGSNDYEAEQARRKTTRWTRLVGGSQHLRYGLLWLVAILTVSGLFLLVQPDWHPSFRHLIIPVPV
jgi:hypothetical protein